MTVFKKPQGRIAVVMILILILALIADMKNAGGPTEKLKRNSYGEGARTETMRVKTENGKEQTVEVKVSPREYTEKELKTLVRQAVRKLDEVVKGENASLDHVKRDLYLPDSLPGLPFGITWESDRYDVINMEGKLNQEGIKEAETEGAGVLVNLTAILKYGKEESLYTVKACLYPSKRSKGLKEQILEAVEQEDKATLQKGYLRLPQKAGEKTLSWRKTGQAVFPALFALSVVAAVCLRLLEKQKEEQEKKRRNEQMMCDYPEIISQFTLLMGAGMTAKNTWKKVTEDYQNRKRQTGRERAAYEEMVCTWKEMQGKIPEAESYERFARRCGLAPYMKFGALLSQNLKKGAGGLAAILNVEALQAMEDRKSRAKVLGEEAGTKLLLPMFLMLVIVMAVIIVPAFWSVQVG